MKDLNAICTILKRFRFNYCYIDYKLINDYIEFYFYKSSIENDENMLNYLWIIKNVFLIKKQYVYAFNELKKDKFHKAWCSFANIENRYKILMNFYNGEYDELDINFIYDYTKKFQRCFPYKAFFSPEFLVKGFKCSICGKKYKFKPKCGHKIGKLYHGKFCSKVCLGMEMLNVAIVKKPADKCTVVFTGDGDDYNYGLIKSLSSNLNSPFDEWEYTVNKTLVPHSEFCIDENDECPCGSGEKYGVCCLKREGVLIDKFNVIFHTPPSNGKFIEYSEYYV